MNSEDKAQRELVACLFELIERSSFDDVEVSIGEMRIHVRKQGCADVLESLQDHAERTASSNTNASVAVVTQAAGAPRSRVAIKAPMLGTFYRAPSPGAPSFVEVGTRVLPGQAVGLIEVMKLFNPITSEVSGVVVEIEARDSELVEFGQTLLVVEADA